MSLFATVALLASTGAAFAKDSKDSESSKAAAQTEKKKHIARAESMVECNAPRDVIWQTLTNFPKYPEMFKRIKTCTVTKREGDTVYIESLMKSQLFIKPYQHTVNDLAQGPNVLKWKLLDGNFKSVEGEWKLEPCKNGEHTKVTYSIEVEPGMVPQGMVSIFIKMVQKEAITAVTTASESYFAEHKAAHEHAPDNKG